MKKEFQPQYKVIRLNLQTGKTQMLSLHYSFKDAKLSFEYWANYVSNEVSYLTWKKGKLWDIGNNEPAMFYRNTMFQYDVFRYEIIKAK